MFRFLMYFAFWWLSRFGFEVLRKLCVNHSPLNAAHHILMRFEPGPRKLFAKLFDILFDKLFEMNFLAICLLWHIFYLGPNPVRSKSKWQSKQPLNQLSEFKHDASNRFLHAKTWIARHGKKTWFSITGLYGRFCYGVPTGFVRAFTVFLWVSYRFLRCYYVFHTVFSSLQMHYFLINVVQPRLREYNASNYIRAFLQGGTI